MLTLTASSRTVHASIKAPVAPRAISERPAPSASRPSFLVVLLRALGALAV
jgi:hypothetical protein